MFLPNQRTDEGFLGMSIRARGKEQTLASYRCVDFRQDGEAGNFILQYHLCPYWYHMAETLVLEGHAYNLSGRLHALIFLICYGTCKFAGLLFHYKLRMVISLK